LISPFEYRIGFWLAPVEQLDEEDELEELFEQEEVQGHVAAELELELPEHEEDDDDDEQEELESDGP
jgi:hypothetical protein